MSRAVCRNCWTWYSKGEAVCPHCHIVLTAAETVPPAQGADQLVVWPPPASVAAPPHQPAQPTPDAPFPGPAQAGSSPLSEWQWWLIGRAAFAVVVAVSSIVSGLFLTGVFGPVRSSDGAFSVQLPTGWASAHAPAAGDSKEVLALARLKQTAGVESHFVVADNGQFLPLATIEEEWQPYVDSGKFPVAGTLGSLTRMTVAGTSALAVDFQGSKYAGELLFLDYGSKTYLIEMSSDPSEFPKLRDSDFAAILASWQWR